MMQRRTLITGLAATGLGGLSACGPTGTGGRTPEGKAHLRMSWWGGASAHKSTLEALDLFMARNPDIVVKGEYTGFTGHLERLTTQISGNTAPDLMQINWYWQALFSRDGTGFYDLNALKDVIDLSQYDEHTRMMGTVKGRLNALAVSNAARLFYYNRTTYDKAGLALPVGWDGLLAAGPAFRKALGDAYYPLDGMFQDFVAMARSYVVQRTGKPLVDTEGKRLNCTREEIAEFAQLYSALTRNHCWPQARVRASFGNVPQQEMRAWINGQFAGTYQWNSSIDKYTDTLAPGQTVELGDYPMRPGATDAGLLYRPAMMFAINRQTRFPEQTARLLDFLLNDPAGVRAMGLRRGVPVSRRAVTTLTEDGLMTGLKLKSEQALAALPKTILESPWFEHPRVRDGFQDILEPLGYGKITEKDAAERLYTDINAILARIIR